MSAVVERPEHRRCRIRTAWERRTVPIWAERRAPRYPIPRQPGPEFMEQVVAIQRVLAPLLALAVARQVQITYWREDMLISSAVWPAPHGVPWDWPFGSPEQATHLSIMAEG